MAFVSVRVDDDVRRRLKAVVASRGENIQEVIGGFIERYLEEARRRPPELSDVIRNLRAIENQLRAKDIGALWVFGSVARGDARPDSDVDVTVDFAPGKKPSLVTLVHVKDDSEAVLGCPIDIGSRSAMKPEVAESATPDMVRVF